MASSIRDLEKNFRVDLLTYPEAKAWVECKEKGMRDFLLAGTGGAIVGWLAGRKLDVVNRLFVTGGVSFGCGNWAFKRWALPRYLDRILSLNGTRMQKELAASLLKRYHDNPKIMDYFRKYFYAEKVYDDSSDIPMLRWRSKNYFEDNAATFKGSTNDHNFIIYNLDESLIGAMMESTSGLKPTAAQTNTALEVVDNPFECVFGTPAEAEEIQSSGGSTVPRSGRSNTTPKRHIHGNKRHHLRRHRKHRHESFEV